MMAYFSLKGLDTEATSCTFIFVVSIIYIVVSYKSVNDNSQFTNEDKKLPGSDLGNAREADPELTKLINNWRADYDHPCVVSKSRRKVAITMDEVFNEYDDWDQFENDSRVQNLIDPADYPANSAMHKINKEATNKSPDQRSKIKKANLNIALASQNASFANVSDYFAQSSGMRRESARREKSPLLSGGGRSSLIKESANVEKEADDEEKIFSSAKIGSIEEEVEHMREESQQKEEDVKIDILKEEVKEIEEEQK